MATTIDLNELLQNFELKNTIPKKESSKNVEANKNLNSSPRTVGVLQLKQDTQAPKTTKPPRRPFQNICNDIMQAFANADVQEGDNRLKQLKEELLQGKKGKETMFSLTGTSDPDLRDLYTTGRKRIDATQCLADACIASVATARSRIQGVREKTKQILATNEKMTSKKRASWNRKADAISKKHMNIVSNNHRIIENDWNKMLKQNESLGTLQGGGSALHRLDMAKGFGYAPSESCVGRAKIYDKSKAVHEAVHWRLRDVVGNVTNEYMKRVDNENRGNLEIITAQAIFDAKERIRKAVSDYYVEDAPLKYEVDMLHQALKEKSTPSHAVTHSILDHLQFVESRNRLRLGKML